MTEICEFCNEESPIGCTGVGPDTEVGMLDVLGVCPRCRLKGIHSSIKTYQNEVKEFYNRLYSLDEDEWQSYHSAKETLENKINDLKYLVRKTIEYYMELYPLLFHPLDDSYADQNVERSGIYTLIDHFNRVHIHLVEMGDTNLESHSIAAAFTHALSLDTYATVRMIEVKNSSLQDEN